MLHTLTNGVFNLINLIESNYEKGGHDEHHVEKMRPLRDLGSVSRKFFVQKFIQGAMLSGPTSYYKELREHAGLRTGNQRLSPSWNFVPSVMAVRMCLCPHGLILFVVTSGPL